ncbi:MAG: type III pantothenate kinase [Anaerolineae bacterium]|nr:type III pantothenate kinase [Anaerolineae bacterium]
MTDSNVLAIDIGNTNIVLGVYRGEDLMAYWRMSTSPHRMPDELAVLINSFFTYRGLSFHEIDDGIISCVVPPLLPVFEEFCERYMGVKPLIVEPGTKTGMRILYDNPQEVGADRIVNAVAAKALYGTPLIVIDFGTATTFDVISKEGDYLGGAIAPGVTVAGEALVQRTAKLPRVELVVPPRAIGRNTVSSMQSGIMYGYIGLVEGMVVRIKKELGDGSRVIATGGLADHIARYTSAIEAVDHNLTLKGLKLLYELNR